MKKSFEIFKLDWKRIYKSPVATLLFIALLILPALYCWFNVWALWDPYSNTSDMKVAVYTADSGTTFGDKKIEVGKELSTQLKENDQLDWTFVKSKTEVIEGVKSGKYYAGIYVPENFSEDLLSFVNGDITKPKLEYYVNTKINAVAPKITDKGAGTLQDTISNEFVTTVGTTMVGIFNKLGIDLDHNLPMLRRFATLITMTDQNLPTIESYLEEIQTVHKKLPELDAKLQQANQLMKFIPEVNKFSNKLVDSQKYLPLVDSAGQMTLQLQQGIPNIYNAATIMNNTDKNFDKISTTLDSSIETLDKSAIFVDKLSDSMPDIQQFSNSAANLVNYAKDEAIPKLQQALPIIQGTVDAGLTLLGNAAGDLNTILSRLIDLIDQYEQDPNNAQIKQALIDTLQKLKTNFDNVNKISSNLAITLQNVQNTYNNLAKALGLPEKHDLDTAINNFNSAAVISKNAADTIQKILDNPDQITAQSIKEKLQEIKTLTENIQTKINQLISLNIPSTITTFLNKLETLLESASKSLTTINTDILPNVPDLLDSTKKTITSLSGYLKSVQKDVPLIKSTLHNTNQLFQNNLTTIVSGINSIAGLYQNDYPDLKFKLTYLTMLIQDDLPRIEQELTSSIKLANEKMPEVKAGLNLADEFIKKDWPALKSGIKKGSASIKKVDKSVDMDELIKLLKRDANKEANFLANPVVLKTNTLFPIPTYGSQSAPFYTALCIWVGALLLSSIISTEVVLDKKQKKRYSKRHQFFGRYMTFLVVGLAQALIVSLGNMFLIHTYVKDPIWFVITTMFIAFSFFSILYALVAMFGNVGKGLGIIILVLSISGAGGNFPVILSGQFFQTINPFLPFTYAVNALRETVGGIYWPNFQVDWLFLGAIGVTFLILGALLINKVTPFIEKIHQNAKKSMIIH